MMTESAWTVLFDPDPSETKTIGKHISNALREELHGLSTVAKFATVANWVSSVRAPLLPGLKNMYLQVLKAIDERKCLCDNFTVAPRCANALGAKRDKTKAKTKQGKRKDETVARAPENTDAFDIIQL